MKEITRRYSEPEVDITLTKTEINAIRKALGSTSTLQLYDAGVPEPVARKLYDQFLELQKSLL